MPPRSTFSSGIPLPLSLSPSSLSLPVSLSTCSAHALRASPCCHVLTLSLAVTLQFEKVTDYSHLEYSRAGETPAKTPSCPEVPPCPPRTPPTAVRWRVCFLRLERVFRVCTEAWKPCFACAHRVGNKSAVKESRCAGRRERERESGAACGVSAERGARG
eukprot:506267-Rhodomonas_salina.1